jgi:hypothetical protein
MWHQLSDDVRPERRVERVVVVVDRVRGIELVAVLAVEDPVGLGLERRRIRQRELVYEFRDP